jgi:hypothetical protein
MAVDPAHSGMDMMYMDMDLMEMTKYYYRVMATNAVGDGEWSDGMAYAMTMAPDTTPRAPNGVTATVDGSTVTVTWTDGENVGYHGVILFNSDFTLTDHIGVDMDKNSEHAFTSVAAGSYIAVVVALDDQRDLITDSQGDYLYAVADAATVQ